MYLSIMTSICPASN